MKTYKEHKRTKAFLGTLISTGLGLVGNVVGGLIDANAKKKELLRQQKLQEAQTNATNNITTTNMLNSTQGDTNYINDYKNRVVLRNGGKVNVNRYRSRNNSQIKIIKK